MSFLTPLYILGALAIAAPIVFHLIRRAPKGQVPFSSLMFLATTPPRLTRRSRLDQVLLLLLRALALLLLALAFARPFLRQPARLDLGDEPRKRVAVVIDTSASLRRGDLWARARKLAVEAIAACRPDDQLAVFAFDGSTRPLLGFDESATLEPSRRKAVAEAVVTRLRPSWGSTDLGQALVDAVGAIEDVADRGASSGRMPRKVVLVSDLQQGARLDALGDFEWPSDVTLELRAVADPSANAGLQALDDADEPTSTAAGAASGPASRIRVTNDAGSRRESFALRWEDAKGNPEGDPIAVYVPPGEGRVVRVPRVKEGTTLRLTGDLHSYDNMLYFAPERKDEAVVVYLGRDAADDPSGLLYYLQRVFEDSARRGVKVEPRPIGEDLAPFNPQATPLVVLTSETTAANARKLREYLRAGGTVLDVIAAPGKATTLAVLGEVEPMDVEEAEVKRDVLLGEIAFDHPLFAPLAGPQFSDFTRIRFWKYRKLRADALGEARVVARFETGDPALLEKAVGKGRLVVLTSGWAPADSQLARSSKFVPLMAGLLAARQTPRTLGVNLKVGDPVPLPGAESLAIRKPDGTTVRAQGTFTGTDLPGVYSVETPEGPRPFAVNLDPAESRTTPLTIETLEQFGCRLAERSVARLDPERQRQLQNQELEGRQKIWRWLILSAIGVLIVETWLAGRLSRRRPALVDADANAEVAPR